MESDARRYREIDKRDFEAFLAKNCEWTEYGNDHYKSDVEEQGHEKKTINEYCYFVTVHVDRGFCLKIYSSIRRYDDVSRDVGEDAIRVVAANIHTGDPVLPGLPKVKRIKKWRKNLHRLMSKALQGLGIETKCPRCEALLVMRKREGDGHLFLGCSKYPKCEGSRNALKGVRDEGVEFSQ